MKIKYIFNIKVLSTLNRLTWNLRGLGRTWGASGSTANFSNLQNIREWWGQVRRGAAVPVLQLGGRLQRAPVLVHEVDVPPVLAHRRLPLLELGPERLGPGRVLQQNSEVYIRNHS